MKAAKLTQVARSPRMGFFCAFAFLPAVVFFASSLTATAPVRRAAAPRSDNADHASTTLGARRSVTARPQLP
jgi:hypothetical protein